MTTEEIGDRRRTRKYQILAALCTALLLLSAVGMVAAYWQHHVDLRLGESLAWDVSIYRPQSGCDKVEVAP